MGQVAPARVNNRQFRFWNRENQDLLQTKNRDIQPNNVLKLTGRNDDTIFRLQGINFNLQRICDQFELQRNQNLNDIYRPLHISTLRQIAKRQNWRQMDI